MFSKRCCEYSIPKNENIFKSVNQGSKNTYCIYSLFALIIISLAWLVEEVKTKNDALRFTPPHVEHLHLSSAIRMSGAEFQDEEFRTSKLHLLYNMDKACEITSNLDVVFAFQFERSNRSLRDHIFMICTNHRIFGNSVITHRAEGNILCTEEYGGVLKEKTRSSNVTMKAIDVNTFKHIEYSSSSAVESCIMQHSLDMLDQKW
jgi:hypothetical protein